MSSETKLKVDIIQVDAWREDNCWSWNNWFTLDTIYIDNPMSNRSLLKLLRELSFLSDYSKGKLLIDDDGYNIEIRRKSNHQPILALCYGMYF